MVNALRDSRVHENKFLADRLIEKLLVAGRITNFEVEDVTWLFRKTLLRLEEKTPQERLEALVQVLNERFPKKVEKTPIQESTLQVPTSPVVQQETQNSIPVVQEQEPIYKEEVNLVAVVDTVIKGDVSIPEDAREDVREYLLREGAYILGTGVNEAVILRVVEKLLGDFKQKGGLLKTVVEETEVPSSSSGAEVTLEKEEDSIEKSEIEKSVLHNIIDTQQQSTTSPDLQNKSEETSPLVQEVAPQNPQEQEVVATEELIIVAPQTSQETAPSSTVGAILETTQTEDVPVVTAPIQEDVEPIFKTRVTSESKYARPLAGSGPKGSLADAMRIMAREQDKRSPLKSNQVEVPMPQKSSGPKTPRVTEQEIASAKIYEEDGKEIGSRDSLVQSPPLPENSSDKKGIAWASNTKEIIDKVSETDGAQVVDRHTILLQQKALTDKYVTEQINTVLQVVFSEGLTNPKELEVLQKELVRKSQSIVNEQSLSISDKINQLDHLFTEKRNEYAERINRDESTSLEDMVDAILARAAKDVRTADIESDSRFRETLRETLHFKAKHLVGIGMDKNKVQSALDEEYVKHRAFYLKNVG